MLFRSGPKEPDRQWETADYCLSPEVMVCFSPMAKLGQSILWLQSHLFSVDSTAGRHPAPPTSPPVFSPSLLLSHVIQSPSHPPPPILLPPHHPPICPHPLISLSPHPHHPSLPLSLSSCWQGEEKWAEVPQSDGCSLCRSCVVLKEKLDLIRAGFSLINRRPSCVRVCVCVCVCVCV